jgi:ribosomal protein L32E
MQSGANPEFRRLCRRAYRRALYWRRLEKPERCEACGEKRERIAGHHASYKRPYDVKFLCPSCHAKTHWGTLN